MRIRTLKIAYVALMSALLAGGKLAMSALPNIEPVTPLLVVFSAVFGWQMSVTSALIFCLTQIVTYGAGVWTISYFIYWPLLALVSGTVLSKRPKAYIAVIIAFSGTLLFGFLDALIWSAINVVSGSTVGFFKIFAIYYANGFIFTAIHLANAVVTVSLLFIPLKKGLERIVKQSGFESPNYL